jgi:hypothetical protein
VRRTWLLWIACASIAVAILAARPRSSPGPFLRDFEAYWSAGSASNARADPYGRAIWSAERTVPGVDAARDEALPFVGPPATLLVWRLFARLPYESAAVVWSAMLAAILVVLVAAAIRGSGKRAAPFCVLAALALAIGFGPVTSDLALGQLALAAFAAATFTALAATRSLPAATAGACVAFAQPNAALGLVSQLGRKRVALALLLGALIIYALGAIQTGYAWPVEYGRIVAAHRAAERFSAIQLTPVSIAYGFGAAPGAARTIGTGFGLLAVVAAFALARRVRDRFACFAGFSALVPFVAGFFHEHDLVVAYAAAVWCALRTSGTARIVALAGTLLVAVDWLGLAQRPTGIAQSALLAVSALCSFAALGEESRWRDVSAVMPVFAVLFAAAAWLATASPAPIWPDALGAFRAPAGASIAALWSAEQRSSGLFAIAPVWALLRSLSLLGCALLAYATTISEAESPRRHTRTRTV